MNPNSPEPDRHPSTGTTHEEILGGDATGQRLDRWLATRFPEHSRAQLQRWIAEGRVTLDTTSVTKPSAPVRAGARIRVSFPPPPSPFPLPEAIPLEVIYEDDALIVINKPAGLVVHSSPGVTSGGSVVNALLHHTRDLSSEGGQNRPGIVHRLDLDTSGILVIARTDVVHRHVAAQFKGRTVTKTYVAAAHGRPAMPSGVIDAAIGRSITHRKKMSVRVDASGGRPSQTEWQLVAGNERWSWFEVHPVTGRTHQIRVHLKSIGHPILCDALYGREKKITRAELLGRKPAPGEPPLLERQALHAFRIRLRHPHDDRWLDFEAPLPGDMQAVRELLE